MDGEGADSRVQVFSLLLEGGREERGRVGGLDDGDELRLFAGEFLLGEGEGFEVVLESVVEGLEGAFIIIITRVVGVLELGKLHNIILLTLNPSLGLVEVTNAHLLLFISDLLLHGSPLAY